MSLGRLLLATELYILIVSSMVFSFYTRDPSATPLPISHEKRVSAETFFDAGPDLDGEDNANPAARPGQGTSSWLAWNAPQRLSSQFGSSYQDGRWQRSDQEVGRSVNSFPSGERVPSMPPSSVNSSVTEAITRAISEGFSSPTIPVGSMYNNGKLSILTAAAMTTSPDSPTLPPDRISEAGESNRSFQRTKQPSDGSIASSGFEDLLREQKEKELDRSIAALRGMFAPGQSGEEVGSKSPSTASDLPERSRLRESSTTAYGPISASNRSEFSLSVFPDPPEMPPITANLSRNRPQVSTPSAVTPTQSSYNIGEQAFPVSTGEGDDVTISTFGHRTVSAGTRYDVTSFIGGAPAILSFRDIGH